MANDIDFKVVSDETLQVQEALEQEIKNVLDAIGATAEGHAKEGCPVDTGRLRNSITYATSDYSGQGSYSDDDGNIYHDATVNGSVDNDTVIIGTNVEYAEFVEQGDSIRHKTGGAHYLANAIRNHLEEYEQIIKAGLE